MKLSQFIQEALWEISAGVTAGAIRSRPFAAIAPAMIDGERVGEKNFVEFDVSLIVTDQAASSVGGEGSLGGEITVAPFAKVSLGVKGDGTREKNSSQEQSHRVTFKVPIYFGANFRNRPDLDESERRFAEQVIATDRSL
jgi:hypothetical protein